MLLGFAVLMTAYGMMVMMPALKRTLPVAAFQRAAHHQTLSPEQKRVQRLALVKVATAYGYWTVCGVLVAGALLVAWLDLREVGRTYARQRADLLLNAMAQEQRERHNST